MLMWKGTGSNKRLVFHVAVLSGLDWYKAFVVNQF